MCFYERSDGAEASAGPVTSDECSELAEADEWCAEITNIYFEAGCDVCEDCAPDWYECW